MPLSLTDRLVASDRVVIRSVNAGTVLLNTETGQYFTLDDVGARAWTVLTSSQSIQEACDTLRAEYAVEPEILLSDLEQLIDGLRAQGLVEVRHG